MNGHQQKILISKSGHLVTITNRQADTMLVSLAAYTGFRQILIGRDVIVEHESRAEVVCELGACIDDAFQLPVRDRNGNLMLLDKKTKIMFIVSDADRILLTAYDTIESRRLRRAALRRAADASTVASADASADSDRRAA